MWQRNYYGRRATKKVSNTFLTKSDRNAMYCAKDFLNRDDATLAAYVLRDTHLAEELGFKDLFWAIYTGGTCVKEMEHIFGWMLEELDKRNEV